MIFTLLLGFTSLFVAGCAAFFSVLGIATLFAGSFFQVAVMASSLELGKLVATSFLYRYWTKTALLLKLYLIFAILILMAITSLGIFGYLSAAYQVNSAKFSQIDSQIVLIEQQKQSSDQEIEQNNTRISTLNQSRVSQEQRLPTMSRQAAAPIYADIERAASEIKSLQERNQLLQNQKIDKDDQTILLKSEYAKTKDIGTFKFVADVFDRPLDTVVIAFIAVLIVVFDPLAVTLILAFNIVVGRKISKETEELPPVLTETAIPITEPSVDEISIEPQPKISAVGRFRKKVS